MPEETSATPLLALDAVAIDSETTGLEPAKAWIVEIAAVRVREGRLDTGDRCESRVRPPVSIPAAATRIHGIDDAAVAQAPGFGEVWRRLSDFIGARVLIGHAIGFDLAVIERELQRAGASWQRPRTLDTRLLAQVAAADLAGYSLDALAAWLGVEAADRHSAKGDAVTAGLIFLALVPLLRERGIRTLAEAERACHALTDVLEEHHRAGWAAPVQAPEGAGRLPPVPRVDAHPYITRVAAVMRTPPEFIAPDAPLNEALARMMSKRISSLFVFDPSAGEPPRPEEVGIVTERDLLRTLAAHGAAGFERSVGTVASRPLMHVPADAFAYLAIGRMARLKVRHLGVVDGEGRVIGVLTARDLLRVRAQGDLLLGDEIIEADSVAALARAWARLPAVAAALVEEGIAGRTIAALISRQLGGLTRRATMLAEHRMHDAGLGGPPCAYAMAVLGSAGREESLLALDQDNAVVFAEGEPDGAADRWFATLSGHVADILHEVGVPYCKGGVMARNAPWRGSAATWRRRIAGWITRSNPRDLLSVDIFFDLRPVHGAFPLAETVWRAAFDSAKGNAAFAKLLAETAGARAEGLGWFGRFRTEQGRIDLKKAGLFGIVSSARTLAIRHHVVERSTTARLAGVKALRGNAERDLDALADAQGAFLDLILAQQIEDIRTGTPATNTVAVDRLSRRDRDRLRAALEAVRHLEMLTRDLLL